MNTRILFTDLDGTLLNDQKEITPGNQAAINAALTQGHKIVIATGRPLPSARIQAERLGLTSKGCYAITYNGGQIYDLYNQKTIYGRTLPSCLVAPLFEKAFQSGIHIQTYSSTHILSEHDTPELRRNSGSNGLPVRIVANISDALEGDPYKLFAIAFNRRQQLEDFQRNVLSAYTGTLDSFFSNDDYLEIVPSGISKGFAVCWLCDYLGIPIENSVAAGDAQNDIPMLEAAHIGAVMRNAFPGIAEHGNYVTEADNNQDGVAEIIHRFILGTAPN